MANNPMHRMQALRQEIVHVQLLAERQNNQLLREAVKAVANCWNLMRWEMAIQPEKCRWLQLRLGDDITAGTPPPFDLPEESFK